VFLGGDVPCHASHAAPRLSCATVARLRSACGARRVSSADTGGVLADGGRRRMQRNSEEAIPERWYTLRCGRSASGTPGCQHRVTPAAACWAPGGPHRVQRVVASECYIATSRLLRSSECCIRIRHAISDCLQSVSNANPLYAVLTNIRVGIIILRSISRVLSAASRVKRIL
jgi:hypothetical protein